MTATLACLSSGTKKDQLAQVEVNEDGACVSMLMRAATLPRTAAAGDSPRSWFIIVHPAGIVFIVTGRAKFTQVSNDRQKHTMCVCVCVCVSGCLICLHGSPSLHHVAPPP